MSEFHSEEYDDELVSLLQLVWGKGFLAPGGPESVLRCVAGVDLAGAEVLDIGCGIGGADQVLTSELGARVTGLDVDAALIDTARRLADESGLDIGYVRVEPESPLPFPDSSFDHVFSHAAIIHVEDKPAMFDEIIRVLRPGGWLLAYDWMRGTDPYTEEMQYWFQLEGLVYNMDHIANYERMLEAAGFVDVASEDGNAEYCAIAHREHELMRTAWYDTMTEMLGAERRDYFIEDWRVLTVVLDQGQLRPGRFRGRKPAP
jgi:phosphoethanolamine N-methyltransferase